MSRLKKNKVAVVTVGLPMLLTNYGSFFQHFALQKVLRRMGFDPYRLPYSWELRNFGLSEFKKTFLQNCHNLIMLICAWFNRDVSKCRSMTLFFLEYPIFKRAFRKLIGPIKCNVKDVPYGCIIGGDQVLQGWNVENSGLVWGTSVVTFSYAASADWTYAAKSDKWRCGAVNAFKQYRVVGLREHVGIEMVSKLIDIKVEQVADPVFLLTAEDYLLVSDIKPLFDKPTLFVYLVNGKSEADVQLSALELLANKLNVELKILAIQGSEQFVPDKYRIFLSPQEFITAFHEATYIVTNSFHGIVFALQFKKPFISILQKEVEGRGRNVRQAELLARFELQQRNILWNDCVSNGAALLKSKINWNFVDCKILEFREFSLNWLKQNLKFTI